MKMPYSKNPHLPRVRMEAVKLVRSGWSTVKVARHLGFSQGTISKWVKRAPRNNPWARVIPTQSSRPHSHPKELSPEIVKRIIELRKERGQCAEILHHRLEQEGAKISLSSVKRTLKRQKLIYPSKWKRWHQYPERPKPQNPGILVEIDTVWQWQENRVCLYTGLDVCSRFAFALATERINCLESWQFVGRLRRYMPFNLKTIQSDHGSEFSKWFTKQCVAKGLKHRHTRIRRPTDNGHLERFNRTIQQECLAGVGLSAKQWQRAIPDWLHYYNFERPHMGLDMKTPNEVVKLFQAID